MFFHCVADLCVNGFRNGETAIFIQRFRKYGTESLLLFCRWHGDAAFEHDVGKVRIGLRTIACVEQGIINISLSVVKSGIEETELGGGNGSATAGIFERFGIGIVR